MEQTLNAVGWACPKPIIETKKILDVMEEGSVTTIVDNQIAVENLENLAANSGFQISHKEEKELFYVTIQKEKGAGPLVCGDLDNLVILIATDTFGDGAKEFGQTLMKGYIYALTEVMPRPKTLIFINSGVFLSTEGSEVKDSLRVLEAEGVEIMSCGACLNFYGLTDQLLVGSVSNMYSIVEKLNNANNTIKI